MNASPLAPPPFSARFFNFNGPLVMPPGSDIEYLTDRGVTDVAAFQHLLQWSADFCKSNGLFEPVQVSGLLTGVRTGLDPRTKLKMLLKIADALYDLWDPEDTLNGVLDEAYLLGLDRLRREVRDSPPVLWQPEMVL